MLQPTLGFIMKLRPSMKIDPNGVKWEALAEDAEIVTGRSSCTRASPRTGSCRRPRL